MKSTMEQFEAAFIQSVGMVKEFHEVFGHPVGQVAGVLLSERRTAERMSYLLEELLEGLQAALAGDKVGTVDALADALYFACGNMVECGVHDPEALSEIVRDVMGEKVDIAHAADHMARLSEQMGWERFMQTSFINSTREFTDQYTEQLADGGEGRPMEVAPISGGAAVAFIMIMSEVLDVDPLAVMQEVHRSNMSKLLPAELDSESACRAYMEFNGCKVAPIDLKFERLDDMRWIAKHMSTNKIIKNPLYSEVDLAPLV